MRIGLVCPYSFDTPGGVQSHVRGLARYLDEQGHEAHILAPGEQQPGEPCAERFTSAGPAVAVPYNGSVARVNFGPRSAARVSRWLRTGGFDVVHLHEPVTPSIALLALWSAQVPVMATFHTATPRSRTMQLAGHALRAPIAKIDAGLAVSESARQVVVRHLGRDAAVVPNGFSHDFFARRSHGPPEPGRWRGGARPRLTFLGRTDEPRKGLDVLLAALPGIRSAVGEVEVVVAGQGTRRLPPGCRAVGVVSEPDKAELLAHTDVFVAPHLARESFGIVLLEAMASRAAVVASNLAPFVDILTGQPSGLGTMFEAGNPAALARAVAGVLTRPDVARTAAAQQASRRYDWSIVGARITEVYRTIALSSVAAPAGAARTAGSAA